MPLGTFLIAFLAAAAAGPFTVAIDPGHGGLHDGAISPSGSKEKDVALSVAKELRTLLESERDVRVVLTREGDDDIALHERTRIANDAKADLLVSIHCNSMPTKSARKKAQGVETYFLSADATDDDAHALAARENADLAVEQGPAMLDPISLILQDLSRSQAHADASLLAEKVHRAIVKGLAAKDRGVRQAPFLVLVGAEMPAVLVEIGFISHPVEGRRLTRLAHQQEVAATLRDAVRDFRRNVYALRDGGRPLEIASPVTPPAPPSTELPVAPVANIPTP